MDGVSVHRRPVNDCKTLHDDSIMQMCVHHIYLVAPGLVVVVHDGGAKAPRRVDPRPVPVIGMVAGGP
jgi:hypothetical protein